MFGKVGELQEVVERQTADLGQMKERMAVMVSRISELEEDLDTARKDLIKSEEVNTRLGRDLREVNAVVGSLDAVRLISEDYTQTHTHGSHFFCRRSSRSCNRSN